MERVLTPVLRTAIAKTAISVTKDDVQQIRVWKFPVQQTKSVTAVLVLIPAPPMSTVLIQTIFVTTLDVPATPAKACNALLLKVASQDFVESPAHHHLLVKAASIANKAYA